MPYELNLIEPMREELTRIGVQELRTPQEVNEFMAQKSGTAMIVVNSVCGCAAGQARPGVQRALESSVKPDRVATVFAGQDLEATAKVRDYFSQLPPSSPSIALFKEGELVHFVPRHAIEGRDAVSVANDLVAAFDKFCAKSPA